MIVAVVALTLGTAQTALADNNATGSVGAVQTGPVAATPTASASQADATATASVPVAVGGSGDNTATNSFGVVQTGGGNTSHDSAGSAQVSSVSASPSASAGASGSSATAGVPLTVGGDGANSATNSIGTAQIGRRSSSTGSATSAAAVPSSGTRTSEGAPRPNRNTVGATKTPLGRVRTLAQLPYTGLRLLPFVLLGLILVATGLTARKRKRTRLSV